MTADVSTLQSNFTWVLFTQGEFHRLAFVLAFETSGLP